MNGLIVVLRAEEKFSLRNATNPFVDDAGQDVCLVVNPGNAVETSEMVKPTMNE